MKTPIKNTEKFCKNCLFYMGLFFRMYRKNKIEFGSCRRYPPQIDNDIRIANLYPLTVSDEWCGEHKERIYEHV